MLKARSITLAFVLGSLVACGGGNDASPPPNTASAATQNAAQTAPTPDPALKDVKEVKTASIVVPPFVRAAVDAADRTPEDRALDGGRKPDLVLSFLGIKPGMRVADLAAGGGYTTELLVRTVGPQGKVYGQNSQDLLDRFLQKPWAARTARPVNAQVVSVARAFDDPLPEDAKDLDAVVMVLFYHDLYWVGTDRAKMNAAIMKALKPGGIFGIVDHSGRAGTGSTEVKTLHRIEEKEVVADVTKAGFKLVESTDALREPDDKRDWNASPMQAGEKRGHSDRFVLKFQKP
jgi:predicted methyltransferase